MLTREELQLRLWRPDYVVADAERGLNKAINRLRDALGDDPEHPRCIETLPQRGYRFVVPVEPMDAPSRTAAGPCRRLFALRGQPGHEPATAPVPGGWCGRVAVGLPDL